MRVLAGDIGGTNARLGVFDVERRSYRTLVTQTFPSREHATLEEVVERFMGEHGIACQRACFGVPGPVKDGRAETTNLPWKVEASRLAHAAKVEAVSVINDLKAQAYGIATLGPDDFSILNAGSSTASGNAALIAAGTGLGQAGLYWDGETHWPFACEGGHASFAPRGELQIALLKFLAERFDHVSWERLLSGPGLANIFEFLIAYRDADTPEWYTAARREERDPAPLITQAALERRSDMAAAAVDLFVELYGAEAGNLALKVMASGGLYVGGGIAPRILEKLRDTLFLNAFVAKGRMRPLLQAIPVRVIVNKQTALRGAARYAVSLGAAA